MRKRVIAVLWFTFLARVIAYIVCYKNLGTSVTRSIFHEIDNIFFITGYTILIICISLTVIIEAIQESKLIKYLGDIYYKIGKSQLMNEGYQDFVYLTINGKDILYSYTRGYNFCENDKGEWILCSDGTLEFGGNGHSGGYEYAYFSQVAVLSHKSKW